MTVVLVRQQTRERTLEGKARTRFMFILKVYTPRPERDGCGVIR